MESLHCPIRKPGPNRRTCLGEPLVIGPPIHSRLNAATWHRLALDNAHLVLETLIGIFRKRKRRFLILKTTDLTAAANAAIKERGLCALKVSPTMTGKALSRLGFTPATRTAKDRKWVLPYAQVLELYRAKNSEDSFA